MEEVRVVKAEAAYQVYNGHSATPRSPAAIKAEAPQEKSAVIDMNLAVQELNDFAAQHDLSLSFAVDKATGRTIIKIVDAQTEEVVRQLPPEEILRLAASLEKMAGALLNTRV
ncbi:MAG: flagellar protein FlaG [Thermodesulfobacteriota bacterium]